MQVFGYTGRHRLWVKWSSPRSWPRLRDVLRFHPATWVLHGVIAVAFMVALASEAKPPTS